MVRTRSKDEDVETTPTVGAQLGNKKGVVAELDVKVGYEDLLRPEDRLSQPHLNLRVIIMMNALQ